MGYPVRYKVTKGFIKYLGKVYYPGEYLPSTFTNRDKIFSVYSNWMVAEEIPEDEGNPSPSDDNNTMNFDVNPPTGEPPQEPSQETPVVQTPVIETPVATTPVTPPPVVQSKPAAETPKNTTTGIPQQVVPQAPQPAKSVAPKQQVQAQPSSNPKG